MLTATKSSLLEGAGAKRLREQCEATEGVSAKRLKESSAKRLKEFNKKENTILRDTILGILEDIGEDVDFDTCETLIDDGILSSLDIIQLIGALNDEFDISIPATEIIPENFNSVDAMAAMVARLSEE